jgi:hypothetical protein
MALHNEPAKTSRDIAELLRRAAWVPKCAPCGCADGAAKTIAARPQ